MRARLAVPVVRVALSAAWFVTLVGGWTDIRRVAAEELTRRQSTAPGIPTSRLSGTPLVEGDDFGLPTFLAVADSELLVIDRYRGEAIVAVDRRTGAVVRSFGAPGEGPGEFESPMSLVVDGDEVAVLDPGVNRITWLRRNESASGFGLAGITSIRAAAVPTDFARLPNADFLVSGLIRDRRLALLDPSGRLLRAVGRMLPDSLPGPVFGEVVQGNLRASPQADRVVLSSRFASRIDIVDGRTLHQTAAWGPERFQPHAGRYETRFGYLDSAPMRDGFLALYSGRTRGDFPGRANYGATIHEFDWDGKLRAVYELDSDVIAIAWSEEDRLLYAARHDPVPGVVVYELN